MALECHDHGMRMVREWYGDFHGTREFSIPSARGSVKHPAQSPLCQIGAPLPTSLSGFVSVTTSHPGPRQNPKPVPSLFVSADCHEKMSSVLIFSLVSPRSDLLVSRDSHSVSCCASHSALSKSAYVFPPCLITHGQVALR